MTKIERIEELERQLAALKAEVVEEEEIKYPYVGEFDNGIIVLYKSADEGVLLTNCEDREYCGVFGGDHFSDYSTPFTGTITYKDGKPV